MLIDYTDGRERHELLCDHHSLLVDYIHERLQPYLDPDMSPGEQASGLGKIMRYLRDNLIIEWKGGTGYTPEPDDEDGYEYNRDDSLYPFPDGRFPGYQINRLGEMRDPDGVYLKPTRSHLSDPDDDNDDCYNIDGSIVLITEIQEILS